MPRNSSADPTFHPFASSRAFFSFSILRLLCQSVVLRGCLKSPSETAFPAKPECHPSTHLLSGLATLEVGVHRSDIAAPETPRRPRGLPRVSYRVWSVSTDRSRDGKGWRLWDPCEAKSSNLSGTSVFWPRLRGPVETTQTRYDLVSEATGTAGRLRSGDARLVRSYLRRRESQPRDVEKRELRDRKPK